MRYFEELFTEGGRAARANGRRAVLVGAVLLVLHYVEVKIEKISVGGSELVIREPQAVKGALGLVLVYLLLNAARSFIAMAYAGEALDAEFDAKLKLAQSTSIYSLYTFAFWVVGLFEVLVVTSALMVTWGPMKELVVNIFMKAFKLV